jgi:ribosomal-protein-alanine N-acetyltransferase
LDAVVELERACATAPHWGVGAYAEIVAGQGARRCLYVAEREDGVVGFAVGAVPMDGVGELESVVVAEFAGRAGVGRILCGTVIGWCREQGAMEVGLEVRAGSAGAIALYEGLGFVELGRRAGYYREPEEDAVVMRWGPAGKVDAQ